jgi:hypothetical protein
MKNAIILLFLILPFTLIAQRNFRPGYIVNVQGDTVSGFIDHKDWRSSPTTVLFKPADNKAVAKKYGVHDLSFFSINGYESYRRSIVGISLHPVKLDDIGGRDTTFKTDTVFLKVEQYGKLASLLSYTDKLKERFYLLERGQSQPAELVYREYLREGTTNLFKETAYKTQITDLVNRQGTYSNELTDEIAQAEYEEASLKKIVVLINKAGGQNQVEEKRIRNAYWFAGLGLQRNGLTFEGDHIMARHPNASQSDWLPRISAGVDLFANPAIGKSYVRIEAGYQVNKSTITTSLPGKEKAVYSLSGSTISLRAQFNYTLYNSGKLKIPLGAGVVFGYMNPTKNQYKKQYESGSEGNYVENWLNLKKSTTTFFGRVSAVFNNKIEASFAYTPTVKLTKTVVYSVSGNNVQLQLYYLFRQK